MFEETRTDHLTKFSLRDSLIPLLDALIEKSSLGGEVFTIALLDLDRFKSFNDKFGHLFGDALLSYAASLLRFSFEEDQCRFFRYGGDEFIIVLAGIIPKELKHLFRNYNYNALHRPFLYHNKFYRITTSCGVAGFPADGKTTEELIKKADQALYYSKRHGRSRITLAGKIKYLRLKNFFLLAVSFLIIAWSILTVYQSAFKGNTPSFIINNLQLQNFFQSIINRSESISAVVNPDVIVLKNGQILRGRILSETQDKVRLRLYIGKGIGEANLDKASIEKIRYGIMMRRPER